MRTDLEACTRRLEAFLSAHALEQAVASVLYTRGEDLYRSLADDPPRIPQWGRFLVAMGELAVERMGDPVAASRYFLRALQEAQVHNDHLAAVTAGFNQGVVQERSGHQVLAGAAYRASASEGFRLGVLCATTLRCASAAVRLDFELAGELTATRPLAKSAWLGWLYLRRYDPTLLDSALHDTLGLQLCALLLPEDDPGMLAFRWVEWSPHLITTPHGPWLDHADDCLDELFAVAGLAADQHLQDESPRAGEPYRLLLESARRRRSLKPG